MHSVSQTDFDNNYMIVVGHLCKTICSILNHKNREWSTVNMRERMEFFEEDRKRVNDGESKGKMMRCGDEVEGRHG